MCAVSLFGPDTISPQIPQCGCPECLLGATETRWGLLLLPRLLSLPSPPSVEVELLLAGSASVPSASEEDECAGPAAPSSSKARYVLHTYQYEVLLNIIKYQIQSNVEKEKPEFVSLIRVSLKLSSLT